MLERFLYTNSFGETLEFGKDCLFVNENDLRDFAWDITTKNDRISGFKKGIVAKTIPIILKCDSEADGVALRNRLFEVFEKDILAKQHGKIHIGEYYLRCYITGSQKTQYLINKNHMLVTLTVQTDAPEWVKESTIHYSVDTTRNEPYLDFSFDYPYDFRNELVNGGMYNTNLVASNFILTISGFVQNPELFIGGHRYVVNVTVGTYETLTIDSSKKTIILTKANKEQVNCFNERNRESYIFEKIPSGYNSITSPNGQFSFSLTLLEERSEPKWT